MLKFTWVFEQLLSANYVTLLGFLLTSMQGHRRLTMCDIYLGIAMLMENVLHIVALGNA